MNGRRFLSLDLNYANRVDSSMYEYLMDHGMTRDEYGFFMSNRLKQHCVMGIDYYITNEHRVLPDGTTRSSGEIFGYDEIAWQYHDRYRLPMMHTETNVVEGPNGNEAVEWLWKQWANVMRLREKGIPIVGFTWYSLTDQVDWDTALTQENNRLNALGLFDLDRNIRNVGKAYKQLISEWCEVLPTESICLRVPVVLPHEYDEEWAQKYREDAEVRRLLCEDTPPDSETLGGSPVPAIPRVYPT
jgi:beta-glucosidase